MVEVEEKEESSEDDGVCLHKLVLLGVKALAWSAIVA